MDAAVVIVYSIGECSKQYIVQMNITPGKYLVNGTNYIIVQKYAAKVFI